MSENFVSALLECERSIFPAFAESGRTFDVAFKERLPGEVEPIGYGLNALRVDRLPVRDTVSGEAWRDGTATWPWTTLFRRVCSSDS